jgi:hypothetical protein
VTTVRRTEQDYAIEHGEYLAKSAERFQQVLNVVLQANVDGNEVDYDHMNDVWNALSSAIYEFRKRARRCVDRTQVGVDYFTITGQVQNR